MKGRLRGIGRVESGTCGALLAMAVLTIAPGTTPAAGATKGKARVAPPSVAAPPSVSAPQDSMTLHAGQSGTEFRSMTVEGEDRVHVDFGRPELHLDLDPED